MTQAAANLLRVSLRATQTMREILPDRVSALARIVLRRAGMRTSFIPPPAAAVGVR